MSRQFERSCSDRLLFRFIFSLLALIVKVVGLDPTPHWVSAPRTGLLTRPHVTVVTWHWPCTLIVVELLLLSRRHRHLARPIVPGKGELFTISVTRPRITTTRAGWVHHMAPIRDSKKRLKIKILSRIIIDSFDLICATSSGDDQILVKKPRIN